MSLEICHFGFVTFLKFEKFILKLMFKIQRLFTCLYLTRFYLPRAIKFSLLRSSGLVSREKLKKEHSDKKDKPLFFKDTPCKYNDFILLEVLKIFQ